MGTLGTLAVSIVGDTKGLEKSLNNAGSKMQGAGKKMGKAGAGLTKNVTAPILGAGAAALGLANKYAGMGDDIAKTSTKLGISTDALQEMDYWATQNGITSETLERGVGRLNQRVGRAADGNEKYAEAFEDVGVSLHDTQGNLRDTEDVMEDTISSLMEIEDPAMRSAKASEIFGTKMARDLMPALEDGSLSIEDAKEKIHEMGGVMGEDSIKAAEEYEDAMDDLKREFGGVFMEIATKLIPIMTDSLIPAIRDHVIPAVRSFIEWIGGLIEWFQSLSPTWQKIIGIAIGFAVAIGPILMVVGKIVAVIGALLPVLKVLGAAFLLLTSPIGLIVAAVVGLIAIFVYLWKTNETFRDAIIAIWETIKAAATAVFNGIKDSIKVALEWIMAFWENWGETILSVASRIWEQIKLVVETAINIVKDVIGLITAIISGDWEEVWERILSIGETIWNFIKGTAENVFGALRDILAGIWDNIGGKVTSVWEGIKSYISDTVAGIYETVTGWFGDLRDTIKTIWDGVLGIIRGVVNNIIGSIEGMVNWSINNINKFINAINRAINTINRIPGVNLGSIPTMNEVSIPRLHSGTNYFRPPGGAREGLALLERGEQIVPRGETGGGDINNYFNIAEVIVRDDTDIEKIAEKLYELQRKRRRST